MATLLLLLLSAALTIRRELNQFTQLEEIHTLFKTVEDALIQIKYQRNQIATSLATLADMSHKS